VLVLAVAGAAAAAGYAVLRWSRPVDHAATRLPRSRGLRRYRRGTGPRIGTVVYGLLTPRRPVVRATSEDQIVVVAGPRTGKTTTLAIPAAVEQVEGPLLITSNKRDIYDAVAGLRSEVGRVWLFDPLGLASDGKPRWWWNPLCLTHNIRGGRSLASILAKESSGPNDVGHAYFQPESEETLADLLVAAARGRRPMSQVYQWLASFDHPEPVDILRGEPDCTLVADGLYARQHAHERVRDGLFANARKIIPWLDDPTARQWIEPGTAPVEFDPSRFATSNDTLVMLSKDGEKWATALVTALTAAVLTHTERKAASMPGGRLERPLLGVLDEAANVCRWHELPNLYSHYGSRGIVLMSIFQSWAQMGDAFGLDGAEKLWSAANVRVYGGGVSDTAFLQRVSDLIGDWDAPHRSRSSGGGKVSRSRSTERLPIYDIATLGSLPPGRALVMLSAARPVLVRLRPWFAGPHAGRIRAAMGEG
jgi:type IV secretory pathway TraG/TraD family ATPase VirD4